MDKRKIYGTILGGIAFIAVIIAATYARYAWQSSNTDLSFSISDSYFYCESGIDSSVSSLSPVLDYRNGAVNSFWVNNIGMSDTTFSISLNISRIDSSLKDKSFKYKIMLDSSGGSKNCSSTSENGCTTVAEGDFEDAVVGMNTLAEVTALPNNSKYHYYLFIYIDGNMQNSSAMQSSTMNYTIDVCEVVVFFDYNGGSGDKTFLKVTDTYDGLPTASKGNTVISFESNGGSSASSQTITHTFGGWYKEAEFTNKVNEDDDVALTTNHTLHAKWNMTDSSGSNTTDGCITLPTPTRTGYTFKGWYKESSLTNLAGNAGGNYCISRDDSAKNITLYAKWEANTYNISYAMNGGSKGTGYPSSVKYDANATIGSPSKSFTVTGNVNSTGATIGNAVTSTYTFAGWTASNLNTSTAKYGTNASTVTTSWSNGSTKVKGTYYKNLNPTNGSTVTMTANWNALTLTLPTVTKTGYICNWNTKADGSGTDYASGGSYTAAANATTLAVTLYAECSVNNYVVSYTLNGGTAGSSSPTSANYDSVLTISNPTRTGYTFAGWTSTNINTSTAYYGTNSGTVTTKWGSTATKVTAQYFKNLTPTKGATVTLVANWTANTYTVNYYLGNGTSTAGATLAGTSTCVYDSACTLSSWDSLDKTFPNSNHGWSFAGWATTTSGLSSNYADSYKFTKYTTASDINLYAIGGRTFTFFSGVAPTSSLASSKQYWNPYSTDTSYLTSITVPSPTEISGWEFIGYRANDTASASVTYSSAGTTTPSASSYTAFYFRSIYKRTLTISYNGNTNTGGSTSNTTATQYYNSGYGSGGSNSGANVTKPTFTLATNGFTKTGYGFSKWADGSTSGTQYNAGATYNTWGPAVTSTSTTKTMYAIWAANTYNISYTMNGGTKGTGYPSSVKYDANAQVGLPTKSFTITGNANSTGATIGNAVTSTYTFAGWTASNLNTSTAKYGTNASTVTTSWSNGSTKVKGTYYKNLTATSGATVTMTANWNSLSLTLPTVTKTGYTCNWNTKTDGSGTDYASGGSYTAAANATTLAVTLYAECTPNTYSITLDNQSATSAGTTKVYYQYETTKSINGVTCYYYTDSALTTCLSGGFNIVKPTKNGYTFKGYFTSTGGSGTQYVNASGGFINNVYKTVGNKTLYAHWVDDIAPTAPTFVAIYDDGSGNYTPGTWTNKQVNTTISTTEAGSGVSTIEYSSNKSTWTKLNLSKGTLTKNGTTWSGTEPWTLRDRNETFYFRACDAAENCSEASSGFNIKYDTSAPSKPTYTAFFTDGSGNYTSGNWTNKQVHTTISATDSLSGVNKIQYILTSGDTSVDSNWSTFNFAISNLTQSGSTWTGTESWGLKNRNDSYYFRACDNLNQCSEFATYTIKYDVDAPTCSLTSTANLKATSQTITTSATNDNGSSGIAKYYFGTSSTGTPNSTTKPSMSASAAGTYYLRISDNAGNVGSCNVVEHSYKVHNMLLTVTGAKGTYSTTNYDTSSTVTYVAPKNTTLTLASIYTVPTGASSSTFKGVSTSAPGTTTSSVSTTAPTLTANSNYGLWFDRTEFTITGKAGTGGSNKLVNQRSGTATASSGGSTTVTVRYGEKVTATATANTGYSFSGWSGLLSGTTNPSTTATLTSAGTITASFSDSQAPTCSISGNPTSWTKNSATLTVSGSDNSGSLHSSPYSWTSSSSGFSTTATKVVSSNGTYTAYVKDAAGNVGNCKVEVTKIDTTAPTTPTIVSMYDIYGSRSHSVSSHFSQNGNAFTTSGNDPYITFSNIGNITGVTGAYVELSSAISSTHDQQIFYETSSTGFNEAHSDIKSFASGTKKLYIPFTNTGQWAQVRYDFGSASGVTFNIKHLAVAATAAQWNADDIILRLSTTESGSGVSYWQYTYSNSASTTGTNANSTWVTYSSSASSEFFPDSYNSEGSKTIYVRVCDAAGNCSSKASTTMKVDKTAPTCALTSTSTLKSGTQTITASSYTDGSGSGIAKYYFGTSSTGTPNSTSLPTMSASAAGTYYLRIQDNVGNIGSCSITMHSYKVYNMLLKTNGTKGTYNTTNYDTSSTVTYVAPKNTTLTLASIYTAPTGASSSTFKGVSTSAPSTTASSVSTTAPTLTANSNYGLWFDRIEYSIQYNACSGSGAPSAQTKRYGVALTLSSTTPTRSGYTFKGWGTACNSTAVYQAGGTYSTNAAATLYAQWGSNYTVTFYNTTGTTALGTQTVEASTATALRTFSNLGGTVSNSSYGWSFAGWSTSTTATSKSHNDGASVTLTANLNLYAIYKRTLTFYSGLNKATNNQTREQLYSTKAAKVSSVTSYTPATITGWTALGYRDDGTSSTSEYGSNTSISPAATVSNNLYAVYSKTFTATFYSGVNKAKTDTASGTAYYNSNNASTPTSANVTAPTPQTITNWTSLGWRADTSTSAASHNAGASVSSSNTYYAVYSRTFSSTFYSGLNKGTTKSQTSSTVYYNSNTASAPTSGSITPPTASSISNWTVIGWRTDTTATINTAGTTGTVSSSNPNYYAVYKRQLTISYNANGGTGTTVATTKDVYLNTNATTTSSQAVTLAANNFSRTNYNFSKWAEGSASGTQYAAGASYNPSLAYNATTFGKTMYAIWESASIVAALNATGGSIPATSGWSLTSQGTSYKNVTNGSRYSTLPTPTRSGYTFNNWKTGYSYGSITKSGSGTLSETVLTGLHPGVTYKITMTNSTATKTSSWGGGSGSAPANFITEIYNTSTNQSLGTVSTSFGSNRSYTIECPSTANANNNLELRIYTNSSTRSNISYTGVNIYTDTFTSSSNVTSTTTVSATGNHMLFADWTELQTYTVSYNANGGSNAPAQQTKTHGVALTLSSDRPTKTGSTFKGWATTSTATSALYQPGGSYTANASVTLYAVWEENTIVAVLNPIGGTIGTATGWTKTSQGTAYKNVTNGSRYSTLPTPTRSGYTFNNWKTGYSYGSISKSGSGTLTETVLTGLHPGITYKITMTNSTATRSGSTGSAPTTFYTQIYDASSRTSLATVSTSFGSNRSYTIECPSTADSSHTLELRIYTNSSTRSNISYTGINIYTDEFTSSSSVTSTTTVSATGNHMLFADWSSSPTTYQVCYNANGGSNAPACQTKTHGVALTLTSSTPRAPSGKTFKGWASTSNATTATHQPGGSYTDNKAVTFYAVWGTTGGGGGSTTSSIVVALNPNGGTIGTSSGWTKTSQGTSYKSITVGSGTKYGTLPTPTRSGYTFGNWWTVRSYGDLSISSSSTNANNYSTVLTGLHPGITYKITMTNATKNSGTASSFTTEIYNTSTSQSLATVSTSFGSNRSYTIECPSTANANNTLELRIYSGVKGSTRSVSTSFTNIQFWSSDISSIAAVTSTSTLAASGNHMLYAGWSETPTTYQVCYNANGGSNAPACQTKTHGVALTLTSSTPTPPSGKTFDGWATTSNATTATHEPGSSYTTNASVTFYAVYKTMTTQVKNYGIASSCAPSNSSSYTNYAETLADAITNATANQCITLLKSITDTSSVTFNKNLKFHTNGKTLTRSVTMIINSGITLTKEGTGTITSSDSVFTVNGNLTANAGLITSTGGHGIGNHGTGTVTINGATVTTTGGYSVMPNNSGTSNACTWSIKSGKITGEFAFSLYGSPKLNISGGSIYSEGANEPVIFGNSNSTPTITISGGSIGTTTNTGPGIYLAHGGSVNMTGGTITRGEGSGIVIYGSANATVSAGTITSAQAAIENNGTGKVEVGTTTASAYHTAKLVNTGTGHPVLYCGHFSSGSKAYCALYKGASLQPGANGYGVQNYNADFRMYSGAYIGCGSNNNSYYCIQNIGTTYSTATCTHDTTNGCFYGRIYIRQGYANGGIAVVYSKVKNVEGVHIGEKLDNLYTFSHYQDYHQSNNTADASKGPVLHANTRGVHLDNTGTSWILDNGLVGGKTAYSNQTATRTRDNHTIGNSEYNGYKWGYLNVYG